MKIFSLLTIIPLVYLSFVCKGQTYTHFYNLDERLKPIKGSRSVITVKGLNEDGLFRLDYFSKGVGNLFLSNHFVDSSLKIKQGMSTGFHTNGRMETSGNYVNNQKDGLWQSWYNNGRKKDSTIYRDGKANTTATFGYYEKGAIGSYSFTDTRDETFTEINYDEKGIITSEVFFTGQAGIYKRYDSGNVKLDSVYSREESEATFPGGRNGWISYLQKNLNANAPVTNGAPEGTYQVIVKFIVAKDGSISNVIPETKWGYGMEAEVIRIMGLCPKWKPAIQYGRNVNAYRRQPITFIVETVQPRKREKE